MRRTNERERERPEILLRKVKFHANPFSLKFKLPDSFSFSILRKEYRAYIEFRAFTVPRRPENHIIKRSAYDYINRVGCVYVRERRMA